MTLNDLTGRLVDSILKIQEDDLPEAATEVALHVLLDGVSTMLAGSSEPLGIGKLVIDWTRENGGAPNSSVVAGGFKAPAVAAAFANGTMAHALDFDNVWLPRQHPMSPTMPGILAVAEQYGFSGRRVLGAIIVAFEVQGRLRSASVGLETGKGFHKPGTIGPFGATAGCGWLLGLDRDELLIALGIAGSRAGSLAINTGTMTKSSHAGHAARMGVECAELARRGWTASKHVFEGGGFFDTFLGDRQEPELLVENFGDPFMMVDPGLGFKKYPANQNTQRAIDAALELRHERGVEPEDIRQVEIDICPFDYINRPQPVSGLEGKFSLQYTTAAALLDGNVTVDSFSNERRFASDMVDLLSRTQVVYDESISMSPIEMLTRVRLTLSDGSTVEATKERITGMVGVPLSREERLRKYHACATRVMSPRRADETLELIDGFRDLADVAPLMESISNLDGGTAG